MAKGHIGHRLKSMKLVLTGLQATKSVDASMTSVHPAWPWTIIRAPPSFENSRILSFGPDNKTATTLLWKNRVGTSAHGDRAVPSVPSIRSLFAELLTV